MGMLDPRQTFDTFDIGPANRLAAAAARSAAQAPATAYNPLVLYGSASAGKTHLLNAMAHLAREVHAEIVAHFEEVESFIDRLTSAIATDTLDEFRSALGQLDLFILDDFQDISGKRRSQQELIQIWDELIARGGQIVIAADRIPQDIPDLDPGLIRRLADGLVVDLASAEDASPPDPLPSTADEFSDFLSDVSSTLAEVVDAAPWRKALAQAILRWEGEGIRTRRLEAALEADSAPDLDALLSGFSQDVRRLRQLAADIRGLAPPDLDPAVLQDPDSLPELEKLLLKVKPPTTQRPASPVADRAHERVVTRSSESHREMDSWFFQADRIEIGWRALDDRILEEMS